MPRPNTLNGTMFQICNGVKAQNIFLALFSLVMVFPNRWNCVLVRSFRLSEFPFEQSVSVSLFICFCVTFILPKSNPLLFSFAFPHWRTQHAYSISFGSAKKGNYSSVDRFIFILSHFCNYRYSFFFIDWMITVVGLWQHFIS